MNILQQHQEKAQNLINTVQNKANDLNTQVQKQMDDIQVNIQLHKPDFAFYLFVNPVSGGNRAAQLLQVESEKITFFLDKVGTQPKNNTQFEGKTECELYFYNMREDAARKRGMQSLLKDQRRGVTVRAIVGGGDGTVMWVVDELQGTGVDLTNCPIGIVPFGTGNDFSRVTGWGGDSPNDVVGPNLSYLKKLAKLWTNAVTMDFDIWDIKLSTYDIGNFKSVKKNANGFQKEILMVKNQNGESNIMKVMKKKFCNYFSFGVDARIGFGFDKQRTQSACCNKCCYCWEGCKKMFLRTPPVINTLSSMEIINDNSLVYQQNGTQQIHLEDEGQTVEVLFTSPPIQGYQKLPDAPANQRFLKGNPVNLLCLNIPSYSGGASDVWAASRGTVGLYNPENHKQKIVDTFHPQDFGDGQIEFVCFQSMLGMANERFIHGQAERCAQGKGPFLFRFKQDDPKVTLVRQYVQIDGEYYVVYHPKFMKIRKTKDLPGGKIQVMVERSFRDKNMINKSSRP